MQPYFLPYIGYWQLLNTVDKFVVYDNVQYIKNGWINRNRILLNSKDFYITIPLKTDSYSIDINERFISNEYFDKHADKLIRTIRYAYQKAPYFKDVMPTIEQCLRYKEKNLLTFIFNSIQVISKYLGITTKIIFSSNIEMDHSLKGQERVIEICRKLSATRYINPIGGLELYDSKSFEVNGIELRFIKSKTIQYTQFDNEFMPNLSIMDVMMFNSTDDIKEMLYMYELIKN